MSAFRVLASLLLATFACAPETPRLDAVGPDSGDVDGGTRVRIAGAGSIGHGPAVVYFGMRSARAVVIVDDRLMTVVTPEAEAIARADLRIDFADGTSFTRPQAFDYTSVDGVLTPIPFVPGRSPAAE